MLRSEPKHWLLLLRKTLGGIEPTARAESAQIVRARLRQDNQAAGATGRVGRVLCPAIEAAADMALTGRAAPSLGVGVTDALADADVLVEFTRPEAVIDNARAAVAAGVHVVIGTSGFDTGVLDELHGANVFFAPNVAVGAVLRSCGTSVVLWDRAGGAHGRSRSAPLIGARLVSSPLQPRDSGTLARDRGAAKHKKRCHGELSCLV